MTTLVIIWRKLWPFKVKTLQYQIINGHPSFVFCRNVYSNVQNDNIKKVFCPSCDILIKGHMIFFNPTKLLLRTKREKMTTILNLNNNMLREVFSKSNIFKFSLQYYWSLCNTCYYFKYKWINMNLYNTIL